MTGKNKEIGESIIKAVGLAVKDIDNNLIEIFPKDTATKANQTLKSAFELSEMGIKVVIGENVTVGHKVIIHGASIGKNTVIGMGSIVMNHAKIGENSIVGANSLITENKEFPPNSLIMGSPAKLIKTLSEDEVKILELSAKHYTEKSKTYMKSLKNETN